MQIYVLSNKGFDGWLKVGKTKCLHTRLSTLRTASPYEYEVELVDDFYCDKPIHNRLMAMGIERSREWFKCDVDVVKTAMAEVYAAHDDSTRALEHTGIIQDLEYDLNSVEHDVEQQIMSQIGRSHTLNETTH